MKKILVTGATGFIGNYVVRRLLDSGNRVIASSTDPLWAAAAPWFSKVEYIPFDLARMNPSADYYDFFGRPDILLHLAWEGLPNYRSAFHLEQNYPRHAAFLANLVAHGLNDLSVLGTCLEYGMQEGCLREDMPARPANAYAMAKDQLRRSLEVLQKQNPFSFKWIRLFYMYGKGQNPNSLFSQLDKALAANEKIFNMSSGEQVRDYLPVEDVANYVVRIAMQQRMTGIFNCCSGRPVKIRQLVEDYLKASGSSITLNLGYYDYPDYEPMAFWGDNSRLNSL